VSRDPELERRLRETPLPGEAEAEERSWEIVRAAYAERTTARPAHGRRRVALAVAVGGLALALGLSPAGAKVGELVEDVVGIGAEDAKPALRSLPTAGELLVESEQGVWIVREDGSKRLLGDYEQATWSPRGLFVAATDGYELAAMDPLGNVRWTISAPGEIADPRWSPSGFRIAYRSGDDLRVVAGDGSGDRLLARDVAPVAPAWRPLGELKLAPDGSGSHILTYVDESKKIHTVDVDSGERLEAVPQDLEQLGTQSKRAVPVGGGAIATLEHKQGRDRLVVSRDQRGEPGPVLFSARGELTGPSWSPDGRWLLVGWPEADQWLFIRTDRPGRVVAFDRISEQFDPGGSGEGRFPRIAGWILPQR